MNSNQFSVLGSTRVPGDPSPSSNATGSTTQTPKKKHRAGRKHKKSRRKSFAAPSAEMPGEGLPPSHSGNPDGFYIHGRNLSNTSIDSEALLDHREHHYPRPRRPSTLAASLQLPQSTSSRPRTIQGGQAHEYDDEEDTNESAPLLSSSSRRELDSSRGYGSNDGRSRHDRSASRPNSVKSGKKPQIVPMTPSERYNVNYPPSMPGTPTLGPSDRLDMSFGDIMMRDELAERTSRPNSILEGETNPHRDQSPFERRHTIALQAQEDVCFPQEGMSELADEDVAQARSIRTRRRRRDKWPDLAILEEWSRLEKEGRSEERRMKKITEPQLVNGRLRPVHKGWYRIEEEAPYRFTYFNEEFQSTIHSQTISELVQPDTSFKDLFLPDPPVLSDSSDEEEDEPPIPAANSFRNGDTATRGPSRQPSFTPHYPTSDLNPSSASKQQAATSSSSSRNHSGDPSPLRARSPLTGLKSPPANGEKPLRYGERPVWWLDVLSPTEAEMKVLSKAFGIHPLTSEDIMLQEQREKVELFRHYYFVNYRSFDQDAESENHLDPVNMYVVVFREGVISFHFSQTPHPANVRRRVRQLKDFMILSADWISYAIIDDITDVYLPLIQIIEDEVDDIDDKILQLHSSSDPALSTSDDKKKRESEKGGSEANADTSGDMLRRVGDCRKKVMTLYRLLGNKADVIKGFAKRCNEHWEVAPRSEIGLYLGDIQDHIVTMTANLSHYEMILARCHANYIAQINIRMNERQEQTADVLGKLTVLGTIVLPMNIITGLWGMNVWVPGQEYEGDLKWFFAITAGLLMFGIACFVIAKRVYNIV
ncbi:cora-domain-containing protein [Hypoxylon trugodes]|uniref:cora-domain-containing protein n=1 Tax=Hypoxylon trugodes TaxID=326681 RepID=UPI002193342D|nr:cora-domain-containing protein [Hypoxylon trugodes]KAI1394249.1 cora-domain-containing protein [Hypoxylon trugodes]